MGNNDDKLRNLCPPQCPFFCNTFCVFSSIAITARCTHPFWSFWAGRGILPGHFDCHIHKWYPLTFNSLNGHHL